tara:strand:- start:251 stop:451 length:201 start_codon:yes stop_codon:yes gene_type:complete
MIFIRYKSRVTKHKEYLADTIHGLINLRDKLSGSLTQENKDGHVKKIIFINQLKRKYLRRHNLISL